jgi:hypothetical protein
VPGQGRQDHAGPERARGAIAAALCVLSLSGLAAPAGAFRAPELTAEQQWQLRASFAPCLSKLKGPYTENYCVCKATGEKLPVAGPDGRVRSPCGDDALFCAAYRAPWAEALGRERMWIANIFSRDLHLWDSFPDHNDLVRGYILEKYFTETNPNHKLAELRAYGGLSGSEYETPASIRFFERYLAAPEFTDSRHFLLAYELQRRFFVRQDLGRIGQVRAASVRVQAMDPRFKPLRDAIHNQISAGLLPKLAAYRDGLPPGGERSEVEGIITELTRLTTLDESVLRSQAAEIGDQALAAKVTSLVPATDADPVDAIAALAETMVLARRTVAARAAAPAVARRLVDLDITAATLIQRRGSALLEGGRDLTARQHLRLLAALTDATYGAGLLGAREHEAASAVKRLLAAPSLSRRELATGLVDAERSVEWAQQNALLAFAEVWAPWNLLLPATASIGDDILRGSPLLLYAEVSRRLDDHAAGTGRLAHELFGASVETELRALNPGLALGRLRVDPKDGGYARDEVVALPETPAELRPAAGILTQGEGNVLSHVQLLARALGIPNVVVGAAAYRRIPPHAGQQVFFIVTPRGRVILKEAAAMSPEERAVYEEYTRNEARSADGSLGAKASKLHIDRAKLDLTTKLPRDLAAVRRSDSGRLCGPKAAFLGELKHFFPDRVARGVVVPFGAYHEHYQRAPVAVPEKLAGLGLARPGERLPDFVERTYHEFFEVMIPARTAERELSAWIAPRLEVIQHSIRHAPLAGELREAIRQELDRLGLLVGAEKSDTVGCFVRSDTNVEDLDNFNGAGLNLTIFNLRSLADIFDGLKEVWASPFAYRSFSWRQTLIDEPLWVLPSVVILESVPSEKSGVLVTADIETGDPQKMLVATSEGVGGAVDGTSAETLLWSPEGVELLAVFKSPWRRLLKPGGGSEIVPATGRETVLEPDELRQLVAAGRTIGERFEPARDPAGRPRPWDIEFGFTGGKLWLFQCRPFVGNDALRNVPALAALEGGGADGDDRLSLEEILR